MATIEKSLAISLDQNREMLCQFRRILAGQTSDLEHITPDDWARFTTFARRHGVAPILYHVLKKEPLDSVTNDTLNEFKDAYYQNAYRNTLLFHELGHVLTALRDASIPVIVLKGACLTETIYNNIALRSMGDVDLLVKQSDLRKTKQVLSQLGYTAAYDFHTEQETNFHHHLPPVQGPNKLSIEIHWTIFRLTQFPYPDEEIIVGIWERALPVLIEGVPCLMLSPEDLLLHLCIHISRQHRFNIGLHAFLDLRKVCEHYSNTLDWEVMRQRACCWRVDRAVFLTLYFAEKLVGITIPECAKQVWNHERPEPYIINWIEEKILAGSSNSAGNLPEFIAGNSCREKFNVLWRIFFRSKVDLGRRYKVNPSDKKIYFLYLVHWFGLVKRHGSRVWLAWKGDAEIVKPMQKEQALRQWLAQP